MTASDIWDYLEKNGIFIYDIYEEGNRVYIVIMNGDWKHEHLRCRTLMSNIGYRCLGETPIEDSEDDCYSAEHCYERAEK